MPFELKVIAEPGSATQCGGCPRAHGTFDGMECGAFDRDLEFIPHGVNPHYLRLPECIEAEKRAKEGA